MRQLHVQVRPDRARRVLELGNEHDAFSPTAVRAERADGEEWCMIFLNLPNDRVGSFIWAVREEVDEAQFVLFPQGTLPVNTPVSRVEEQVRNVAHRSTLELVLGSLQSLGSWKELLLYSVFSGIVAAYGLLLNASFLLVAAMLIAPMGAPGMVAVVGATIGDWKLVGRGALRFVTAVAVLVATAAVLGYAYGLEIPTSAMEQVTSLSVWTVLVALVAGAAGAQSQIQSERSSLVTATATGFLIAAALSPASATLGLSIPLKRWDYAALMGFVLGLQFVALIAGGWLALHFYDVRPGDPTVGRGERWVRNLFVGVAILAVAGLVWWQTRQGPRFFKVDVAREAAAMLGDAVAAVPGARLIEGSAHFTRPDLKSRTGEALLIEVVVEQTSPNVPAQELETAVRRAVQREVSGRFTGIVPFVQVSALPGTTPR